MICADAIADDEADGGVAAKIVDGPLGGVGVGGVSRGGEEEDGGVEVGAKGDVVHVPEIDAGGVRAEGNVQI